MVNWQEIKAEYLASGTSFTQLAKKYGVSKGAISKRASKEGWKADLATIRNETQRKTTEKISDAQSDIASIKSGIDLALWQSLYRAMNEITAEDRIDTAELRRLVQCYAELRKLPDDSDSKRATDAHAALVQAIREITA